MVIPDGAGAHAQGVTMPGRSLERPGIVSGCYDSGFIAMGFVGLLSVMMGRVDHGPGGDHAGCRGEAAVTRVD